VNVRSVHHQLQATTPASSRLIWEIFYSRVDGSLWQVAPDNLKRFLKFGACFQLCFKLAVSFQHCTPYGIVQSNLEAIGLLWWYLDNWPAASFVRCTALHAVCADAPSCWKMNPVGNRRLLQRNDNLIIISKQNKLLFIKTLPLRHRQ